MFDRDEDVEVVLLLDRFLIAHRANRTLGQEGSPTFYDDCARGNPSFNRSAPGDPYTASAFEGAGSLPLDRKINGPDWTGELQMGFVVYDNGSCTHLAAQTLRAGEMERGLTDQSTSDPPGNKRPAADRKSAAHVARRRNGEIAACVDRFRSRRGNRNVAEINGRTAKRAESASSVA